MDWKLLEQWMSRQAFCPLLLTEFILAVWTHSFSLLLNAFGQSLSLYKQSYKQAVQFSMDYDWMANDSLP